MATLEETREQRVVLRHATWETYERLLDERGESRVPRFTYDRGVIEIMSPLSAEHEECIRNIEFMVRILSGELGLRLRTFGSMTLRRRDIAGGLESDGCFYVRSVESIRGKTRPDLDTDPPPDLAIEVDITNPSLDKLPIYARLGVPEIWRYDGKRVAILVLTDGAYAESVESQAFRGVTSEALSSLVRNIRLQDSDEWERQVRAWARSLPGSSGGEAAR